MRKVAWLIAVIVLGIAGCAFLHAGGASGTPSGAGSASRPGTTGSANIVKVATSTRTYSMTAGGLKRSYEVIAPVSGLPRSAPVIVMLSGIGATVSSEITRDKFVPYASTSQAEIVYPVAVKGSWNAIDCCGYASAHKVDDMAFLKALVLAVDPGHARPVYVVGYSNGARLAYRVACTDPRLFDGYAAVKGGPSPDCMVSKPVTIAQLASLDDPETPYKPGDKGREPDPGHHAGGPAARDGPVPGQARRDARGQRNRGHVVRVRGRHPARVRDLDGRQALLPAAPGERPGGRAGHLVVLHEHSAGTAAVGVRTGRGSPGGPAASSCRRPGPARRSPCRRAR